MRIVSLLCVALFAMPFACRGDDNNGGGGDGGPDSDGGGGGSDVTIYDIQSDDMPVGTAVTVRGVVVTAIDNYGGRTGGVYVQEPEGGAFSGVFVFVSGSAAASLVPGDLVDVQGGVKDEFALNSDDTGRTLTEISPPEGGSITINKVGDGSVPAPEVVNPWDLAASDAEAEKWEGVLVKFDNVRVLRRPDGVSNSDSTLREMTVTGPFRISSSLTELDPDAIASGDCYTSITGIGDYFFSYKILPRSAADLSAAASDTCLAPEETMEMCIEEGNDNDYNGFTDCEDFGCQFNWGECRTAGTVVEVQNGTITEGTRVEFTDVVVTAIHPERERIWVQDDNVGAAYNGAYVFSLYPYDATLPEGLALGDKIDMHANVDEYNTLTELTMASIDPSVQNGPAPVPLSGISIATLTDATDGEQYEGVLVTLSDVEVIDATPDACTDHCEFSVGTVGDKLWVADDLYQHVGTTGSCLGTLTGVMHFDTFDDSDDGGLEPHIVILPRDVDDISVGGGC